MMHVYHHAAILELINGIYGTLFRVACCDNVTLDDTLLNCLSKIKIIN
jgi:hypothetical protein